MCIVMMLGIKLLDKHKYQINCWGSEIFLAGEIVVRGNHGLNRC